MERSGRRNLSDGADAGPQVRGCAVALGPGELMRAGLPLAVGSGGVQRPAFAWALRGCRSAPVWLLAWLPSVRSPVWGELDWFEHWLHFWARVCYGSLSYLSALLVSGLPRIDEDSL